jgi:ABC-type branched-subunit amino acid transport system substrate-binding protein
MTRRPLRMLALLLALAMVLAACRADDTGDDDADAAADDDATEDVADADEDDDAGEEEHDEGGADDDAAVEPGPGVTSEPCPAGVNPDNGCIYLGSLNDLTEGAFAQAGPLIQDSIEAFWQRVNEDGGIGGYDIDISSHVRDNLYTPEAQTEVYADIREDVLGLGLSLGSSTTLAIVEQLEEDDMFAIPMAWNSDFPFESVVMETGANYCVDSMNAVDYFVEERGSVGKVLSVHYPNDYGQDADVGVRIAADAHDAEHVGVQTPPGPDNQGDAIQRILAEQPDLVVLTTNPTDAGALVGQAFANGYEGFFIGQGPTWNAALLQSPAAEAFAAGFWQVAPYPTFDTDTPGHDAMREWVDAERGNDFHTAGWVSQYPVKAAIEAAAEAGDVSRTGVLSAMQSLTEVDFEGMLPAGSGNYAGAPNDRVVRASNIGTPDPESSAGVTTIAPDYIGATAAEYDFAEPCLNSY